MATNTTDVYNIITNEAVKDGIPPYIALTIAQNESSLNPNEVGDNGTSFGLFQLHRGGLAPSNLSNQQLFDPQTNASIGIPAMKQAYEAGAAKGLKGFDLVAYTANNSAYPGNIGTSNPQAVAYDVNLKKAYDTITGTGGGTGYDGGNPGITASDGTGTRDNTGSPSTVTGSGWWHGLTDGRTYTSAGWMVLGVLLVLAGLYVALNPLANLSNVIDKVAEGAAKQKGYAQNIRSLGRKR